MLGKRLLCSNMTCALAHICATCTAHYIDPTSRTGLYEQGVTIQFFRPTGKGFEWHCNHFKKLIRRNP